MLELKKITAAQAEQAKLAKVTSHPKRLPQIQENYAMDAVQRDLNLLLTPDQIDNGGLYIYTTLDPTVQKRGDAGARNAARARSNGNRISVIRQRRTTSRRRTAKTLRCRISKARSSRSTMRSGGIRALVGGRDYAQSKFNRALAPANRQVGSVLQAVCLCARLHARDPARRGDQRWPDPARRNPRRGKLDAGKFRRQIQRHPARFLRTDSFAQHDERARR